MRLQSQHRENGFLGRFLVISFILHILLFVLFPEWQPTPLPGVTPGDGALQFTLRDAPEAEQVTLNPVHQRNTTPEPQPRPEPREVEPEPSAIREEVVVQATTPPQPPSRPQPEPTPAPQDRTLVAPDQPTPPQPTPRPKNESEQRSAEPEVEETPVMTRDRGDVAVSNTQSESAETGESSSTEAVRSEDVEGTEETVEHTSERTAVEAPTTTQNEPPPPPPTVGSMLRLPGGQHFPKRILLDNEITIRVFITVDADGNIIASEIDPATRSDNEDANVFAQQYAERLIQAEAASTGQAYQASLYITFDPHAQGPMGIRSSTESGERVRFLDDES